MMEKISVIVPSYNSSETIIPCLKSLSEQDFEDDYEIIVVDSSSDGTEKKISELFPRIKLIHLAEKTIPGKGRNIGAGEAEGTILAFTDSDCIVDKKWLKNIWVNIQKNHFIVGGSVTNARPESAISRAEFYIEFREFSVHSPKREIRFLPSCNFAIKKDLFASAGGFPDVRASEDTFFAHKLTRKNHRIYFDPDVKISHLNRNKLKAFLKNQYIIGKYAAVVRKILPMPGGFFVKLPYAFPVLPLVRSLRTLKFIFQNSMSKALHQLLDFIYIYPIFLLGSMVWSYGFYRGIRTDETLEIHS